MAVKILKSPRMLVLFGASEQSVLLLLSDSVVSASYRIMMRSVPFSILFLT